ncbi:MAG: hypothetical protein WBV80_19710 [Mycobacterium sp.]
MSRAWMSISRIDDGSESPGNTTGLGDRPQVETGKALGGDYITSTLADPVIAVWVQTVAASDRQEYAHKPNIEDFR